MGCKILEAEPFCPGHNERRNEIMIYFGNASKLQLWLQLRMYCTITAAATAAVAVRQKRMGPLRFTSASAFVHTKIVYLSTLV